MEIEKERGILAKWGTHNHNVFPKTNQARSVHEDSMDDQDPPFEDLQTTTYQLIALVIRLEQ
jgi:hypothetical protein